MNSTRDLKLAQASRNMDYDEITFFDLLSNEVLGLILKELSLFDLWVMVKVSKRFDKLLKEDGPVKCNTVESDDWFLPLEAFERLLNKRNKVVTMIPPRYFCLNSYKQAETVEKCVGKIVKVMPCDVEIRLKNSFNDCPSPMHSLLKDRSVRKVTFQDCTGFFEVFYALDKERIEYSNCFWPSGIPLSCQDVLFEMQFYYRYTFCHHSRPLLVRLQSQRDGRNVFPTFLYRVESPKSSLSNRRGLTREILGAVVSTAVFEAKPQKMLNSLTIKLEYENPSQDIVDAIGNLKLG